MNSVLRLAMTLATAAAACGCAPREGASAGGADGGMHFRRGMWDLAATGSIKVHSIDNDQVDRALTFDFSPQYGYFLTDEFEVLAAVGVEYSKVEYDTQGDPLEVDHVKTQNYSAALGVQYNFDNPGPVVPFARLYGGLVKSRRETVQENIPMVGTAKVKDEDTAPYLGVRIGIRYFLSKNVATDVGLGWKRVWYDEDFGGDTDDFSLVIGAALFF